jgi:hypothetical protein
VNEWLQIAGSRPVVRRATKYAVGVGTLLIVINHGDALVHRDIDLVRVLRMALTVTVPYMVSTASQVGAILERKHELPPPRQ